MFVRLSLSTESVFYLNHSAVFFSYHKSANNTYSPTPHPPTKKTLQQTLFIWDVFPYNKVTLDDTPLLD
jgi:hypothetical protein